jgi:hypothetical protein
MEARYQANRPAFPATAQAILVAMNQVTRHTMAHLRLDRAHSHPSFRQGGRRILAAPAFGKAANQRTSSDPLDFARPFFPPSLRRPNTRLRTERIGGWTSRATCHAPRETQAFPDLSDQAPGSDVIQDSDFPWEIAGRLFDSQKISALRASGALQVSSFSAQERTARSA